MATTTTPTSTVTLKLLVDKHMNRVLFAEATKEFVDFLFFMLSLPVGTIVSLLTKKQMVGSIGNLYQSIQNFSTDYMQPGLNKDCILKPKVANSNINVNLLTLPDVDSSSSSTAKTFYRCPYNNPSTSFSSECRAYVTTYPYSRCPRCKNSMSAGATYVDAPVTNANAVTEERGYVKGVVTYTVMDDLVVKPMSTISAIALLSTYNITDIGALEEKVITFGMEEAVKLMKASLESKTVLTDVFLGKKMPN